MVEKWGRWRAVACRPWQASGVRCRLEVGAMDWPDRPTIKNGSGCRLGGVQLSGAKEFAPSSTMIRSLHLVRSLHPVQVACKVASRVWEDEKKTMKMSGGAYNWPMRSGHGQGDGKLCADAEGGRPRKLPASSRRFARRHQACGG